MKPSVVYIVSDTDKSLEFEWTASLLASTHPIQFVLIGKENTQLYHYLNAASIPVIEVPDRLYPSFLGKLFKLYSLLRTLKPNVVHCHLWRAMILGLPAAYMAGIKKRVFTRHHAMIHYYEHPKGRKWDRLCNWLATDIIAISQNVKQIIVELDKSPARKITVINHGFMLDYFNPVGTERLQAIQKKYKLSNKKPVIGAISRYLELKGIQFIIPAFQELLKQFPDAHLILANARGEYQQQVQLMLKELPPTSYTEIPFESDLAALYQLFDVFVHVPLDGQREAFGQTYVEALAFGIPSVFTLSGVAPEFIKHEENALVVPFSDSQSIYQSVLRILQDNNLRMKLIERGKASAKEFPIDKMVNQLNQLYEN